ncbi:MAG: exodeoxyribonuclease VII small subunit [Planctomycetaceae bacterium]
MATNDDGGPASDALPPFEQSFAELQQIAHELEEGSLGLEDSLKRYERGIVLLRQCYRTLEQAEQRIAILSGFDASGNAITKPFDASATVDQSDAPSAGRRKRASSRKSEPSTKSQTPATEPPAAKPADDPDDDSRLF